VCHVSFYEADAYDRWAGKRLPHEVGGEAFAVDRRVSGNYLGTGFLWTVLVIGADDQWLEQMFEDIWEWTQSK
jgi:formylglycine-generating enzyme required for sulfatase activity